MSLEGRSNCPTNSQHRTGCHPSDAARPWIEFAGACMSERFCRTLALNALRVAVVGVFLLCPVVCVGQENPDGSNTEDAQPKVDAEGCEDLAAVSKLPGSIIESCQRSDSSSVSMPLAPDSQGHPREKVARGPYEFRSYQIWQTDQQ